MSKIQANNEQIKSNKGLHIQNKKKYPHTHSDLDHLDTALPYKVLVKC